VPNRRPGTDEHARHVDGYHGIPVFQGQFEGRMATVYAGIVEQDVDMTVSKRYVSESPFDRLRVPHVCDDRFPVGPEFFCDLRCGCLMGIENHYLCAGCSEGKSDRSTDAAAAAGYDRNLAFEQKIRKWGKHRFLSRLVFKRTRLVVELIVAPSPLRLRPDAEVSRPGCYLRKGQ
jgi:hypothetical protein